MTEIDAQLEHLEQEIAAAVAAGDLARVARLRMQWRRRYAELQPWPR